MVVDSQPRAGTEQVEEEVPAGAMTAGGRALVVADGQWLP